MYANKFFIISFHENRSVIERFIGRKQFKDIDIVNIEIPHEEDDKYIESNLLF